MSVGQTRLVTLGFCVVLLSGCVVGNWSICGPQTPLYHCDAEAERALLHPTPIRDQWERPGSTNDARRGDWVECGGNDTGGYHVDWKFEGSIADETRRIDHGIQRCMLKKGYRYTGACNNEITMAFPGCGAP